MDKKTPLAHMTPAQFRKNQLDAKKEQLRVAPTFMCACCHQWKDRPEADNAYIWEPRQGPLAKLKMKGVPIYVLCAQCKSDKSPDVIYQIVAKDFIDAGLFGDVPTEEGKQLLGMK